MRKKLSKLMSILVIIILLATIFSFHIKLVDLTKNYSDEYRSYYIPSSLQVKVFSLGYHNAISDLLYLWFLHFYDWYNKSVRYSYMEHTFEVMTDLDPKHQEAYLMAALFAFIPLKWDLVYKFLDKGIEKNLDNYVLPYEAGCYAFFSEKNYERAVKYLEIAYKRNPNKSIIKNLYAKALSHKGDLESALEYFEEIYNKYKEDTTHEGNYYRTAATRYIWMTKNAIAERDVSEAVSKYRERYGKNPSSLKILVNEGMLKKIPKDPLGEDYEYSPQSGEITCVSKFDPKTMMGRW